MLEALALLLASMHFSLPLAYYLYVKTMWLSKPWNLKIDENYRPKVTVILPTYNEAGIIWEKLDDIYRQDYPKKLLKIVVVDSASADGTPDIVKKWADIHPDVHLSILQEPVRRGMVPALNYALKCTLNEDVDVILFTDADAFWLIPNALVKVVKYFADPDVGALTTSVVPLGGNEDSHERLYRSYYNALRVAESKIHSTPVCNAPLMAYRASLIRKIGGLPEYTGNQDSTPASIIAFMGYRVIQVDDVMVTELIRGDQLRRKIRRAQHLLLGFLKTKGYVKKLGLYKPSLFEVIWKVEWWLHVINPWLLMVSIALLLASTVLWSSSLALALLGVGLFLLISKTFRTWVLQQLYLIIAAIRNLWTKEIMWNK